MIAIVLITRSSKLRWMEIMLSEWMSFFIVAVFSHQTAELSSIAVLL